MVKDDQAATASATAPKPARPVAPAPNRVAMVRRVVAHWPLLAGAMIVGGLATAQVISVRKPAFKSETVIFYREGVQRSLITNDPGGPDPLRTLGAKLKEMLLAQTNLKRVIGEFHLYPAIVEKQDENAAVEMFRRKVDFKARSTDTFAISFEGTSREEAQVVTARLADLLVEQNAQLRQEQARTTTKFLEAEKKHSDDDLEKCESELAQFVAEHPEFASDSASGSHVGIGVRAQQLEAQDKARGQVVRKRAAAAPAATTAPVPQLGAAERAAAQAEVAAAQRDLADKQAKYTDEHPDVRAARARVAAAELGLRKVEDRIASEAPPAPAPTPTQPPPTPAPVVKPAPETSAQAKAGVKNKDEAIVATETEWARLSRDVAKARQRAADLENRLFKAEMTASSERGGYGATIAVLDPAYRPTGPSSMPNKTVLAAGFVASLLFGIALAAFRGLFLDDRIFAASEIEELAIGPVLGVVPRAKKNTKTTRARRG